jgi:hypothetical protein
MSGRSANHSVEVSFCPALNKNDALIEKDRELGEPVICSESRLLVTVLADAAQLSRVSLGAHYNTGAEKARNLFLGITGVLGFVHLINNNILTNTREHNFSETGYVCILG